jgi:lipopolysaccharide/colanic/teichoic acid biosynthesis glycosyltransferase
MKLEPLHDQSHHEDPAEASANVESGSIASFLAESQFRRMVRRERKRSERSRKHLLLMLIDDKATDRQRVYDSLLSRLGTLLSRTIRDTDLAGWYETSSIVGVIFTELGPTDVREAIRIIRMKVTRALEREFKHSQIKRLQISFFAFPETWTTGDDSNPVFSALYPDLHEIERKKKFPLLVKRVMDVMGSSAALALLSPAFLILSILIKLTSKGPVFFRQTRVGQFGRGFKFLKFRSMYVSSDAAIHQTYMKNYIAGSTERSGTGETKVVYKIQNDPRVTWIGRFMRRTSLDEIPQFWNVLKGEMSLVGPRPPIPYEIEAYDIWHRQRVLEAKPGITGLWQVHGRSRTTFDEMVRLDIQYSRTWSPLMDLKILLQTPRAVFSGDGAY